MGMGYSRNQQRPRAIRGIQGNRSNTQQVGNDRKHRMHHTRNHRKVQRSSNKRASMVQGGKSNVQRRRNRLHRKPKHRTRTKHKRSSVLPSGNHGTSRRIQGSRRTNRRSSRQDLPRREVRQHRIRRRPRHVQRNQGKGNKEWKDRTIQHDRNVRTSDNNRTRTSRELGNTHSSTREQRMELRNEVYTRIRYQNFKLILSPNGATP